MTPTKMEIYESLKRLREDAIAKDLKELAIIYGWQAINLGCEILTDQMDDLRLRGL